MVRRLVLVVLVAAAVALGAAGFTAWRFLSAQVSFPPGAAPIAVVVAGDGIAGVSDGPASQARFSDPFGVAIAPDGGVYVADAGDAQRIRRLSPDGVVSTVAGGARGFADGAREQAAFDTPSAIALDRGGILYIADTGNNAIRRMTPDGVVSTIAGDGVAGFRDGPRGQARFNGPVGVAVDSTGRVIVADTYNDCIRAINIDGTVTTLAGGAATGLTDGDVGSAAFDTPSGVAIDDLGNIFVADTGNSVLRIVKRDGTVATLTSAATTGDELWHPVGVTVGDAGMVYVTDARGRIVSASASGVLHTVAGSRPGFADGAGGSARFRNPSGLAWHDGRLMVADTGNSLIRLVATPEPLGLHLPASPRINPRFDADGFAWLPLLWPVEPMGGPHEVAGTMGEARGDAGGEGRERFHAGIDVREAENTPVLNVRPVVVTTPVSTGAFGSLSEYLSVSPVTYVHMRVGRDRRNHFIDPARFFGVYDASGKLVRVRVKRGTRFQTGDVLGTINRFNHVHLNVGWSGEEYNPLLFRLPQFDDTIAPTIARGGVKLYADDGTPLEERNKGRVLVNGVIHVVVDAWDRADLNMPRRRLGIFRVGYQLLDAGGEPLPGFAIPRETMRFDRLASDPEAPRLVFAPGSGIPFYGTRLTRFRYEVTNTLREGRAAAGSLDLGSLAPGDYTLRVLVADTNGTEALSNRDVAITVQASETSDTAVPE